jgi:hypothetical protein
MTQSRYFFALVSLALLLLLAERSSAATIETADTSMVKVESSSMLRGLAHEDERKLGISWSWGNLLCKFGHLELGPGV